MQLLRVSPSNEEQMEFLSKISKHKPVICSIVSPYSDAFKPKSETSNLPSSLRDLHQPQNEELTYSELLEVCEQIVINVDNEEVTKIEMFTCDQNKSSSNLSVLLILVILPKVSLSEYFIQILQNSRRAATAWGCEHESSARIAYIRLMKSNHTDFSCKESGLVVSLNHPFIGASPDGVVHCECCGHGVMEIKCPYCIKDEDPGTASCLLNGKLSEKHADRHFILATFNGQQASIFVEQILPNKQFIEECVQKFEHFLSMRLVVFQAFLA